MKLSIAVAITVSALLLASCNTNTDKRRTIVNQPWTLTPDGVNQDGVRKQSVAILTDDGSGIEKTVSVTYSKGDIVCPGTHGLHPNIGVTVDGKDLPNNLLPYGASATYEAQSLALFTWHGCATASGVYSIQ